MDLFQSINSTMYYVAFSSFDVKRLVGFLTGWNVVVEWVKNKKISDAGFPTSEISGSRFLIGNYSFEFLWGDEVLVSSLCSK